MFTSALPREGDSFDLVFRPGSQPTPDEVYRRFDNVYTEAPPALREAVEAEVATAGSDDEAVRRIVDFVAQRFDYGARNPELTTPQLVCDIASGNCIDINTILLSAFQAAGVEACYRAGFFFKTPEPGTRADGMHCWVTTRVAGRERHWDIAHCLQTGRIPVVPSLNPAGGLRVAASTGRGLTFALEDVTTEPISHFARPHWVFADGGVMEAEITTTLRACEPGMAEALGAGAGLVDPA
jgi:transglutaminase-like putative cysteine protease